jgi:hypothetical protein
MQESDITHSKSPGTIHNTVEEKDFLKVCQLLKSIHYGSVTIVVQDGKIVQIEKNEKIRIK